MIVILFITTLAATNPDIASVNQAIAFDSMPACNTKAIELNKEFKSLGKPYVAGCAVDNEFVHGARMGAYSTIKKYEYCLLVSDLKNKPVADGFKECTKIITDDIEAIWPPEGNE